MKAPTNGLNLNEISWISEKYWSFTFFKWDVLLKASMTVKGDGHFIVCYNETFLMTNTTQWSTHPKQGWASENIIPCLLFVYDFQQAVGGPRDPLLWYHFDYGIPPWIEIMNVAFKVVVSRGGADNGVLRVWSELDHTTWLPMCATAMSHPRRRSHVASPTSVRIPLWPNMLTTQVVPVLTAIKPWWFHLMSLQPPVH